jgi:hypothetical protein
VRVKKRVKKKPKWDTAGNWEQRGSTERGKDTLLILRMKIQWNLGPINSKHDKSVLKKRNCGSRREGKKIKEREKKN